MSLCLGSILAAAAITPVRVHADDRASATVDTDFLEFLGSLDSDDVVWSGYLNNADADDSDTAKATKPTKPPEKTTREGESK